MNFVGKVWKVLVGIKDGLVLLFMLLFFVALFGVLSAEAGLGPWETQIFSIAVFAGASQLAALQLMQDQAPVLAEAAPPVAPPPAPTALPTDAQPHPLRRAGVPGDDGGRVRDRGQGDGHGMRHGRPV